MEKFESLNAEFIDIFNIALKANDNGIDLSYLKKNFSAVCIFLKKITDEEKNVYIYYDIISSVFLEWMYSELSDCQSSDNPSLQETNFLEKINAEYFEIIQGIFLVLYLNAIEKIDLMGKDENLYSEIEDLFPETFDEAIEYIITKLKLEKNLLEANRSHIVSGATFRTATNKTVTDALEKYSKEKEKQINTLTKKMIYQIKDDAKKQKDLLMERLTIKENELAESIDEQGEKLNQKTVETSMTILGVFVGVVMVFFGGFAILENTISGLGNLSAYRLYFTMLMFGLILFNIVVVLFYLISRITSRSITCICPKNKNNECANCKIAKRLKFICRFKNTMPYVYWGNMLMISGLVFIFLLKEFSPSNAAAPDFSSQTLPAILFTILIVAVFLVIQHIVLTVGKR